MQLGYSYKPHVTACPGIAAWWVSIERINSAMGPINNRHNTIKDTDQVVKEEIEF